MNDICVKHISKSFDDRIVLRDYSKVFRDGENVCIMGASGCGKTTLLRIMLGLCKPDSGEILGMPKRVSVVFQEDRLCEDYSVYSNIRAAIDRHVPDEKIFDLLKALRIEGELPTVVRDLSGGMKRRVAIARALLYDGSMFVMDEPFRGLDDENRRNAAKVILGDGRRIICVTHNNEDADLLNAGKVFMEAVSQ